MLRDSSGGGSGCCCCCCFCCCRCYCRRCYCRFCFCPGSCGLIFGIDIRAQQLQQQLRRASHTRGLRTTSRTSQPFGTSDSNSRNANCTMHALTSSAASSFSSQHSEAAQGGRGSKLPLRTLTTIASTMPPHPLSRTVRALAGTAVEATPSQSSFRVSLVQACATRNK